MAVDHMLNDVALTQTGLAVVYAAVGVLMALTERIERSRALKIWTLSFYLFALDAFVTSAIALFGLPQAVCAISWFALTGAGVAGVAGTIAFIGRPLPKGLFVLGGVGVLTTLAGLAFPVDPNLVRVVVFVCIGLSFLWSARLTCAIGIRGGVGRWVTGSAFVGAGLYAMAWPVLRQASGFARIEFFLDLSLVMWGAAGALLVHFERSRERIQAMATQELELRAQIERTERLEALARLAGGVAHDFNNVLMTVIQGSELALRQLEDRPTTAAHIELVLQAARGAAGFTRQLLALGRRRLPGRKPIRVNEALRGAMCMVRPTLLASHGLVCPPIDDSVAIAAGDGQLEQVIVNLSLNAIDAMPNGGTLELSVCLQNDVVRLTVRDSGCGMDQNTLKRIFEPFFSTKSGRSGTGLGLAAVYAIVKQLDGRIEVESTQGAGTCFTVDLPRCEAPPIQAPTRPRSSRPPSTVSILLVDDQESVLKALSAGLSNSGYRVTTATCAEQAIQSIAGNPPSLLLADLGMPGTGGLRLIEHVRRSHPGLPVIMMTGHANDEDMESGKYGAQWLVKPFTTEKLEDAIDSALAG
jgi:signal transduction histidine kinase/CheY-like chemotaxis protein